MDGNIASTRRRWLFPCMGGAVLASFGSVLWLISPEVLAPEEADGMILHIPAPLETVAASDQNASGSEGGALLDSPAGTAEWSGGFSARVATVRSWSPRDRVEPLIFVCGSSSLVGRQVTLLSERAAKSVTGRAVAAPASAGSCEDESATPPPAGRPIDVVLAPEDYLALATRGTWDLGSLRIILNEPVETASR